ncbi:chromosome partitioning protein ParB [Cohnella sp. CIP 111063]|uniref:ParB/RepB/Spo0J family partition protein n=1 Tax=unclassified Cohnella TaxID=2636738 RepID=UPI000B8C05D7|nr:MULTISPECIES: ParB/RepB/Spo0J family partition protein [unclassified Cohnella]OXS60440.1 chromosome partitioning protein ParB [Cohnella sp. CIP 111063]PRX73143.1 ParB family chromosome partitioning protein [Cohnella sp. SGD-V74]
MDIIPIPAHLIDEDKEQPRYQFDDEALQELMNSIGELGLLSPIKVRKTEGGRYKIIYGNRRYKACTALNLPTIPCIVSEATDEMEIYLEQIAENLTRQGFSPIEEAEAFNKLLNDPKFSSSIKYLSSKLGKPENYIKNKLDLLKFSPSVRQLISAGTEIKKGRLTEDQLMPLKDLPMEYRDSLALIMAEDEMAVTDVKRIARLFKDKEISDATKGKLLFKTGYQLLETWSTYEHNRKERAKNALPKEEPYIAPESTAAESGVQGGEIVAAGAPDEGASPVPSAEPPKPRTKATPEAVQLAISGLAGLTEAAPEPEPEEEEPTSGSYVEDMLNLLLATLPAPSHLSPSDLPDLEGVELQQFARDVDTLIADLEKHLSEWRSVKDNLSVRKS